MKKHTLVLASLALGLLTVGSLQLEAQAEKKSDANSITTIKMLPGDENAVHPPVDKDKDDEDEENEGTGNKGTLTIDRVPNIKFGDININGSDQVEYAKNSNPYTQVTDVRGTSNGWALYVKADEFASDKNEKLTGAALTLNKGNVVTNSTGKTITPPIANNVTLTKQNQKIMTAAAKSGEGTWMLSWKNLEQQEKNKNIQLSILAGTAKANTEYKTTIYWELQDAPGK
ncbi:WxL domain-containing protein [Enterococcus quebecensis]|uniref:WxL domain-containing protein n=1 Tax=Enterococcus quebecensis TaxID=903983 RepID=A0A1E5GTC7_9ENTE|nr:WxL domain-containing protein [Enterococcus quebecensis]OEG15922.1 hypothetical protein BCR23_07175 [Enterococcus quebecensis]OJG74893.1 hypothetical protein RV12_GL001938 [Enterococcus quebecensis]